MIEIKEQLWQAQKLESIGQLAGGIAHDFNNILTVILGYSKEILSTLQPDSLLHTDVGEIVKAGQKALNLTRQLLTFSRKHIIKPQVIQLNTIIGELTKMLVRLIGEDIEYNIILEKNLGYIKIDIFQIEQAIMNLVINARDAMPTGGKLWIETSSLVIDQASVENFAGIPTGNYIMLTVSDTGSGMSKEISNRIFEPFYTTKQVDRGTGLGLSLVYGIVTQADGLIKVYSEPGHGTTFKIFLPQTAELPAPIREKPVVIDLLGNEEQIIVVDDDAPVGILIKRMIEKLNYQVTLFENPEAAIDQIKEQAFKPDLLVTDVIMPGMNGKELADRLHLSIPELKVLFMSGYADNVIFHSDLIQREFPFIQKPFTREAIGLQIRQLLRKKQEPPLDGTFILMIDDDDDIMRLYKRNFEKKGYQLICRESLIGALEALSKQDFKVILVDSNIPGTDGQSIIKGIREAGYNTPVIAISGDINSVDLEALKPLNVIKAFEKSTDIQSLVDEINNLNRL
jgi:CheY-like chemotaxis protein